MEIAKRELASSPIEFYMPKDTDTVHHICSTKSERDFGIILSDNLKWNNHVSQAVSKANAILAMLKRTFTNWNVNTFRTRYTAYVRPHLEYATPVLQEQEPLQEERDKYYRKDTTKGNKIGAGFEKI